MTYFKNLVKETASLDPVRTLSAKNTDASKTKALNSIVKRFKTILESFKSVTNVKLQDKGFDDRKSKPNKVNYDISFSIISDKSMVKEITSALKSEFAQLKPTISIDKYKDAKTKKFAHFINVQISITQFG